MKRHIAPVCILLCICTLSNAQSNQIASTGPIGIGTTSPIAGSWLHIYRNASGNYNPLMMLQDALSGGFTQFGLKATGRTFHVGVGNTGASFGLSDKFYIWDQNATLPRLVIDGNGSVGIGTTDINSTYKLFVEGAIRTRKVTVDQSTWPDYVFNRKYELLSLQQVEQYIAENNHLPEVPSAEDVKENGSDLGDMQAVLLKKIEELTLYIIAQNKKIDQQQRDLDALKKSISIPQQLQH